MEVAGAAREVTPCEATTPFPRGDAAHARPGSSLGSGGMTERHGANGSARTALAVLALLLAPWLFRGLAVGESPLWTPAANGRGFAADAAVSLAVLGLLWALARIARWLAVGLVGVLAVGYYANYETVTALGSIASPLDLKFFGDPTFVRGSATVLAHPFVLVLGVLASSALAWRGLRGAPLGDAALALAAGGFALGILSLWEADASVPAWRQENAIVYNADLPFLLAAEQSSGGSPNPARAMRDLVPSIGADLAAPYRVNFDGRGKNVLLVVLESVSGLYVPTAAEAHGRVSINRMHNVDRAMAQNLGYTTFFTHQRRTNRGLYSLLCGEYPRLLAGLPKMAVASTGPWARCLPQILDDNGYRTAYLQAAPLAFMQKDRFMSAIGFRDVLGHAWFRHPEFVSYWGVDDKTFFQQALREVDELEAGEAPWFLTLLTVGTHHPYTLPPSAESPYRGEMRRAFVYLDEAFGQFMRALEMRGLRHDTLILVTSDESRGDLGQLSDGTAGMLSEHWGFLIAMLPEGVRARVDEPFALSDVALSVLDYLGLGDQGRELFGRSVFRDYPKGRLLFYGNLNHRMIGGLKPDGSLVMCEKEGLGACARYLPPGGRIFAEALPRGPDDPGFAKVVTEMAHRSLPPAEPTFNLTLIDDPIFPVRRDTKQMVQGAAQLELNPGQWIEVEVEMEARGDGRVAVEHIVKTPAIPSVRVLASMDPGQTLRLHYTLTCERRITSGLVATNASRIDGKPVELFFRKRRLVLHREGEPPALGPNITLAELDPPAADPSLLTVRTTAPCVSREPSEAPADGAGDSM